jgi:AcrR family transcriptional regulator
LSPDERRADRRRRLLQAALELFGAEGYAATSLTAVCVRAGISVRHFYEHFSDREQLLLALYEELLADLTERVRAALAEAPAGARDRIVRGLEATIGFYAEDPRRARVVQLEAIGVSPALDARRRDAVAAFAGLIEAEYRRVHPHRRTSFRLVGLGLVGVVNELLVEWVLGDDPADPVELRSAAEEIYVAVFDAGAAAGT